DECYKTNSKQDCSIANITCKGDYFGIFVKNSGVGVYDIRTKNGLPDSIYRNYLEKSVILNSIGVNTEATKFIEVDNKVYSRFADSGDIIHSMKSQVEFLLDNNIPMMFYTGDADFICNWMGGNEMAESLKWKRHQNFKNATFQEWTVDGVKVGEIRKVEGLWFVKVFESGHLIANSQPKNSLELFKKWIKNKPILSALGHSFNSKQDAENFYITAKGQTFLIEDENVGIIEVYFKPPTHYTRNNNSNRYDNGEGTSSSTTMSNEVYFKPPTHYKNNSNRYDNGEGTSCSTTMSNFDKVKSNFATVKTNFLSVKRNDTKAKSNQESYESISSASNVAELRRCNTENLIEFLLNDEEFAKMNIGENFLSKLHEEDITVNSFIRLRKADLKECGLKICPSLEVEEYISSL
ncbi:6246_t:CDS:2, partial [Gigaspora rosea]